MLVEFSVSNFRSFKEKATLSMVASSMTEHYDTHTYQIGNHPVLLRTAALYGANASGKSNLIKAFNTMRDVVRKSSKTQRGDKLKIVPHLFDIETQSKPTEFEAIFIVDGIRYQYGFSANSERIIEEWLFAFPKGRAQRWFSRVFNWEESRYINSFSEKLVGPKQLWTEATRENSLYLSTAVQLNSSQLAPIFDWFDEDARVISFQENYPEFTASLCTTENSKSAILTLLQAADFDIKDIEVKEDKFDPSNFSKDVPDELRKVLEGKTYFDVKTVHDVQGGAPIQLDIDEESDGTKKFFGLAGPWFDILATGKTVFVDELHDNLHPQMVNFLVSLFNNERTNPLGAQLIFSTHDTAIMDQKYLRRDQVWFIAKKKDNSSKLYPLSSFSPRKAHEDLAKNYLSGRYGAVPYFKDIAEAMGAQIGE